QDGDTFAVEPSCGPTPDCDDTDPATHPGASEVCGDGKDNNCDTIVDEGCPTAGECAGQCGSQAPQGCWCDELCAQYGDCCAEVCSDCSTLSHCAP
ncbi:MAG: putative metal-binding motif-containing protein, partial [Myxococcales bacterium]|nr:putative metal-binding motif-containing protein [Myxococcales bacterium]